jgi:prepilin-type N-terminal cleavage/methylation domain-containing protein
VRNPRGFTIVELLAATALSTLLFLAALSVIRTLGKTELTGAASRRYGWELSLRQQLRWDFANAVVLRHDEHGLILGGYGSLDPQTFAPTHRPVRVIYSLRDIGTGRWLVREQTSLDPLATDLDSSELLCGNVKSFSITGSYAARTVSADTATSPQDDPTPVIFQKMGDSQRVPDRIRVRIDLNGDPAPAMNAVLYLR